MGLTALTSCGYLDLWVGDTAATLTDSSRWLVLPMRSFVSRDTIRVDGMQLCTVARCGYDAAIERFSATGEDATELEKSLSDPRQLAAVISKPRKNIKLPPPKVAVENFSSGKWSGVQVAMAGGRKAHHINGYVVSQRNQAGATFIVVIAARADIAQRLIMEATQ